MKIKVFRMNPNRISRRETGTFVGACDTINEAWDLAKNDGHSTWYQTRSDFPELDGFNLELRKSSSPSNS